MTNSKLRHAGPTLKRQHAGPSLKRQRRRVERIANPFHTVGLCLVWAATAIAAPPATGPTDDVVIVTVRSTSTVMAAHVLVGDVADVRGGSARLREQLVRLDLADAPHAHQSIAIPANQIACRIQVAGIDPRLFLVRGAESVTVRLSARLLAGAAGWYDEGYQPAAPAAGAAGWYDEGYQPAAPARVGRIDNPAYTEGGVRQVRFQPPFRTGAPSDGNQPAALARDCRAQVLTEAPVLIKQRELVQLVARVGPLEIKAKGEALQDGKAGQLIRIRNVDSSVIVVGRVVEHAVVEVAP